MEEDGQSLVIGRGDKMAGGCGVGETSHCNVGFSQTAQHCDFLSRATLYFAFFETLKTHTSASVCVSVEYTRGNKLQLWPLTLESWTSIEVASVICEANERKSVRICDGKNREIMNQQRVNSLNFNEFQNGPNGMVR